MKARDVAGNDTVKRAMKHMPIHTRFVYAGAAAILLAACEQSLSPNTDPIAVALSADRSTVTATAPVQLTITVTNRGATSTEIADPRALTCPRSFEVTDASGKAVTLPTRACAAIAFTPRVLAAGESVTVSDQWAGDESDGAFGARPLAAGSYRITARIMPQQKLLVSLPITVVVASK